MVRGNLSSQNDIAAHSYRLILFPTYFTPGMIFQYDSTQEISTIQSVPYLTIANSTQGNLYAYSPSNRGDRFDFTDVVSRLFSGPRTILTLLISATASLGQILPIAPLYNHSTTTVGFYGPAVKCFEPDMLVKSEMDKLLAQKMNTTTGTLKEFKSAYFGFVPTIDSNGTIGALTDVRYQTQTNDALNEVWQVFQRYNYLSGNQCDHYTQYQVCRLWNASYDLTLSWNHGIQNISGSREYLHEVAFPEDKPGDVSNMAQHAASAFLWALGEQIVGSFGWFNDTRNGSEVGFGVIGSPIQHNVLLGSSDLGMWVR